MNIENIIDDVKKYHYVGCGNKKCKIISSSNSKSEAKNNTFEFFDKHDDNWEDLIGNIIYLITIRKSTKEKWDKNNNSLIPGPCYMEITEYIIKKKNILKEISTAKNKQVFFTEKYIKKNNGINTKDITNTIKKFESNELKIGIMEKNIL